SDCAPPANLEATNSARADPRCAAGAGTEIGAETCGAALPWVGLGPGAEGFCIVALATPESWPSFVSASMATSPGPLASCPIAASHGTRGAGLLKLWPDQGSWGPR